MDTTTSKLAGAVLGAAAVVALLFSPAGDQGFFPIVMLGPLLTGIVVGLRSADRRPAAGAWALVGVFMLVFDWIARSEDRLFHVVLTVLMVLLVLAGGFVGRLARPRSRQRVAA